MSQQIDLTKATKVSIRRAVDKTADTTDKSTLRFYTIETISAHRSYTPEGYLLCEEATLSRTGTMLYKADEVPVTAGEDGLVTVVRYDEDVFAPESIASANGKSVCNNHPAEGQDISPENWRALEVGVILHPRRGSGAKKDCLVADLLIKDKEAIRLIESGKVQLSCGYDADYDEIKPGYARQTGIIINHVAIVENGRCGPRCAIMDEDTLHLRDFCLSGKPKFRNGKMAGLNETLKHLKDALNKTHFTQDQETEPMSETNEELLQLALEGLNNRLGDIERRLKARDRRRDDDDDDDRRSRDRHHNDRYSRDDDDDRRSRDRRDARRRRDDDDDDRSRDRRRDDDDDRSRDRRRDDDDAHFTDKKRRRDEEEEVEAEAGDKNKDRARKSKDSGFLEDSWKETVALAECLVPGIAKPQFTRDASPIATTKALCDFRKSALTQYFTDAAGRQLILDLNRGQTPDFVGMSCGAARQLFRDCAIVAKRLNNTHKAADSGVGGGFGLIKIANPIISDPVAHNAWAAKHWDSQPYNGKSSE